MIEPGDATGRGKKRSMQQELDDASREKKQYKSAIDQMVEEFMCPITRELPLDPCTAEDGRGYERTAIESWINQRADTKEELKSPMTNEPMGPKLLPAVQAKNTIRSMVNSGAISGEMAQAWKQRIAEEEELAVLRRKATEGCAGSMALVGDSYRDGKRGLAVDLKQAFEWYQRAADLDHPRAMTEVGRALMQADGVEKDMQAGLFELGRAAGLGSEHAYLLMGFYYQHGAYGVVKNAQTARKWYLKMPKARHRDTTQKCRDDVANWLIENHFS